MTSLTGDYLRDIRKSKLLDFMKSNCIGRNNAITAKKMYQMVFGNGAFISDSDVVRYFKHIALRMFRNLVNKTEQDIHIIYDMDTNSNYIYWIAETKEEVEDWKEKMEKIVFGIRKTEEKCMNTINRPKLVSNSESVFSFLNKNKQIQ